MKISDILILLLVTAVWGFNFVPVHVVLQYLPPMTVTALRFILTVFPAIFFIKRPAVPMKRLAAYGIMLFAGQFSFLFSAIHLGLAVGLASLVLQVQAFFTIGLGALILREHPKFFQVLGAVVAAGGIAVVGFHVGGDVTVPGLICSIIAAFCWSCGNLLTKSFGKADMFAVIVWGNFFAIFPMLFLAYFIDGPTLIAQSIAATPAVGWLSFAYIVLMSTGVGYTLWSRILARHPTATVAPFTLLVPAFGLLSAALVLGEAYPMWKFWATMLIMCGLALNQFGGKIFARLSGARAAT